jgi:hypothetical protein
MSQKPEEENFPVSNTSTRLDRMRIEIYPVDRLIGDLINEHRQEQKPHSRG